MKTVNGSEMFIIQQRDLIRVTNVSGVELGVAGLLGRLGAKTDILVWGQTFMHCGLHKEWERERIAVAKHKASELSLDQLSVLNNNGFINASVVLAAPAETAKPKVEKKKKPEPVESVTEPEPEAEAEPVAEPEAEPEAEPVAEPEAEPVAEEDPLPKAKKKRARKKKTEE